MPDISSALRLRRLGFEMQMATDFCFRRTLRRNSNFIAVSAGGLVARVFRFCCSSAIRTPMRGALTGRG